MINKASKISNYSVSDFFIFFFQSKKVSYIFCFFYLYQALNFSLFHFLQKIHYYFFKKSITILEKALKNGIFKVILVIFNQY